MTVIALPLRLASRTYFSWLIRSRSLSKFKFFVYQLCIICQSFVIMSLGRPRSLSKHRCIATEYGSASVPQQSFLIWASSMLRCISSIRFLASSSARERTQKPQKKKERERTQAPRWCAIRTTESVAERWRGTSYKVSIRKRQRCQQGTLTGEMER